MLFRTVPALFGLLVLFSCGDGESSVPPDAGGGVGAPAASAMVGPAGGGLVIPGVMALGIPAGALTTLTEISVFIEDAPPAGFTETIEPVLRFEPSGLSFAIPVLINVEAPPDFAGRLFWSRTDGSGFDPIGFVEFGKARAYVTHFSTLVMSGMGCEDTLIDNNQICECWDGGVMFEEGTGRLCPVNPLAGMIECPFNTDVQCVDFVRDAGGNPVWRGREGDACSGYGRIPNSRERCYCIGIDGPATGLSLCAHAFDLSGGMMACPCGIWNFSGANGRSCVGYYVRDHGPPDYRRDSSNAIGRMNDCTGAAAADNFETISGMMRGCFPDGPVDPPTYPDGAPPAGAPPGYPEGLEGPAPEPSVSCPAP